MKTPQETLTSLEDVPTNRLAEELQRRAGEALLDIGYDQPIDLLDPDPAHPVFSIKELATRLAREYRYSNSGRYTVAQHSVHVSEIAREKKLAALLHDAPEALLHDLPHPAKQICPGYRHLEENIEAAVEERYGVNLTAGPVKEADRLAYNTERKSTAIPSTDIDVSEDTPVASALLPLKILPEGTAEKIFLEQYDRLTRDE